MVSGTIIGSQEHLLVYPLSVGRASHKIGDVNLEVKYYEQQDTPWPHEPPKPEE